MPKKNFKRKFRKNAKKVMRRKPRKQNVGRLGNISTMNNIESKSFTVSTTKLGHVTITGANGSASAYLVNDITDLPNSSTYLSLFDRYKIRRVKATFKWVDSDDVNKPLGDYRTPQLFMRYNYDSNAATGTQAVDLKNAKRVVLTPEKQMVTYTWIPKTVSPVYLSSVATGYKQNPSTWIDGTYTGVDHYGLSYYIDYLPTNTQIVIDLELTVSFAHKL